MKLERLLRFSPIPRHELVTKGGIAVPGTPPPVAQDEIPPAPAAPDTRTFLVIAQWPDRRITYSRDLSGIGETIRLALTAGATHVAVEPEWQFERRGAA